MLAFFYVDEERADEQSRVNELYSRTKFADPHETRSIARAKLAAPAKEEKPRTNQKKPRRKGDSARN
ncbi:hypothetical protein [Cytobacillus oceanisediminis]|uniref:hypothetical protein n=1 Tax=Cytobacillus oceanisediminis TaxID=665099 RepID=UPI0033773F41